MIKKIGLPIVDKKANLAAKTLRQENVTRLRKVINKGIKKMNHPTGIMLVLFGEGEKGRIDIATVCHGVPATSCLIGIEELKSIVREQMEKDRKIHKEGMP